MHVAIFGAGALGSVYGVRLALRANAKVTWIVRPAKVASTAAIAIERVKGSRRETLDVPLRAAAVPEDADVVVLAVGTEDLDAIRAPLARSTAPIVVLPPMLPAEWRRLREAFPRAYPGMPAVVSYVRAEDGVARYWLPPAPTRIEAPLADSAHARAIGDLTRHLRAAGLRARVERGVHERNSATTVSYIAIAMAFSIAGSAAALLADDALLAIVAAACREGVTLGHRLGRPDPWAALAPAAALPLSMRAWLSALRRLSPESLFYAEEHFGRKLRVQHRVMVREIIALARDRRLPHDAFDALAARLDGDLP